MQTATPNPEPRPLNRFRGWVAVVSAPENRVELVGAMTLLLFLLYSESIWYLEAGVYTFAIAALLHRPLMRQPWVWVVMGAFLAVGHARTWFGIDNHKYLITYWCFAFGLSLMAADPLKALRTNARLLIGLAFLFAVVAKLISPDYMGGSFFRYMVLSDGRFFGVASFFGGIPAHELQLAEFARRDALAFGDLTVPLSIIESSRLDVMAQVLTWWTILIEAVVAVLFLWPLDRGVSRWRDVTLLLFVATTYPVAPVVGFAWVLCAMGAAQSTGSRFTYGPALYAAAFVLVLLSTYIPVARFFPF